MGGLIVVVLWPMILPVAILEFLGVALPVIAPILLGWNIAVLALLLLARRIWRKSGTMERSYLYDQPRWKRVLLLVLRWGLLLFIVWEILLVAFFAVYLIWGHQLLY